VKSGDLAKQSASSYATVWFGVTSGFCLWTGLMIKSWIWMTDDHMNHSCVLGEDDSDLIITPYLWVCQDWLSSSGHFMNSLHLMKCTFVGRVFHPKFPHLLYSHSAMNTLRESCKSMFVISWQEY